MGKDKQKMDVEIRHCSVGDQWPQCYVTRIRPGSHVSRIRYISDTDTCPIRPGYVSSEYPNFYYFREY